MKNIAFAKRRTKTVDAIQLKGIETGNSVDRLLPTEWFNYYDSNTRPLFFNRLADEKCLQYCEHGKKKQGEGPLVLCRDVSGSMADALSDDGTTRCEWAAAVSYAFWTIAQKQKRKYYQIEYDNSIISEFEVDNTNIQKLLAVKAQGGTNFNLPIVRALSFIEQSQNYKKADIIFITDGSANVTDNQLREIRKRKKELNTCIYSVQLSNDKSDVLYKFSETVIKYDGSDNFQEIFNKV